MGRRVTNPEISSLAAKVLQIGPASGIARKAIPTNDPGMWISVDSYNELLESAKRLAGSALGQDETRGQL